MGTHVQFRLVICASVDHTLFGRYNTVRYAGTVRYGTVTQYGTVRYGTVKYGIVRYGTVQCHVKR